MLDRGLQGPTVSDTVHSPRFAYRCIVVPISVPSSEVERLGKEEPCTEDSDIQKAPQMKSRLGVTGSLSLPGPRPWNVAPVWEYPVHGQRPIQRKSHQVTKERYDILS